MTELDPRYTPEEEKNQSGLPENNTQGAMDLIMRAQLGDIEALNTLMQGDNPVFFEDIENLEE